MKNPPEHFARRIQEAKENNLTKLDLSCNWSTSKEQKLTELPLEVTTCTSIEELDLSFNMLTSLPSSISNLQKLKTLKLSNNTLTEVPKGLANLKELTSLDLGFNNLDSLPDWIARLNLEALVLSYNRLTHKITGPPTLTRLDLSGNDLKAVPHFIFGLANLESLQIESNAIGKLHEQIFQMPSLREINCGGNPLSNLGMSIGQMRHLEGLGLGRLDLSEVPEWIGQMEQLTALSLSGNSIKTVPAWFKQLRNLEGLVLAGNQLSGFPEVVCELPKLKDLDLSNSKLRTIPSSMSQLKHLEALALVDNLLKVMPEVILKLPKLKYLNLSSNGITTIPVLEGKVKSLETLWLVFNEISALPDSIGLLVRLSALGLVGNQLTTLPDSLAQLKSLTRLELGNNLFHYIPDVVYELSSLERLQFSNGSYGDAAPSRNQITAISSKIMGLRNLAEFTIADNPIETPPPEVVARGLDGIKSYFRQLEMEGRDYLYEAKLLIVGEGGAGKTTLSKKILDPTYTLTDSEKSTEGIEVNEWRFETEDGHPFRVNIWDFGGQEIYHSTHQFFLTKRSLYLLIADTRKEDTDFYYWLNAVDLLTDGSPILVIKNEKQDRHREINERQLRGQFSNLKETLSTNLATNRGLEQIVAEIKHHICKLPHIGTPLPKTWVKVREVLENDPRNYVSFREYLDICEKNGFTLLEDKLQLSGYLHDLGVCLHFQQDPILNKVVILKPRWGTDAVYKVLDSKTVVRNLGKFSLLDLSAIWDGTEYDDMHAELLQLMINFRLCYKLPNSESYIAPQLLSENKAQYQWSDVDNLILRYTYEFMPKGIITQFIVAMNNWIAQQSLVWKSGVLIEDRGTTAEIIEYYNKREIKIRVSGRYRKDVLTIVNYELDKIHSSYNRLKYSKWIPCNCDGCNNTQNPHFYSFDVLQKFIEDKEYHIQCQSSYKMVEVTGLMDDVKSFLEINPQASKALSDTGNVFQGSVGTVVIQYPKYENEEDLMKGSEKQIAARSAWANGSFYLFTFAVVIAGLGVLAQSVSGYALVAILVAGILFIPIIGGLQLRQDDRLSEKSFIELIRMSLQQLPLIGRFLRTDNSEKLPKGELKS